MLKSHPFPFFHFIPRLVLKNFMHFYLFGLVVLMMVEVVLLVVARLVLLVVAG